MSLATTIKDATFAPITGDLGTAKPWHVAAVYALLGVVVVQLADKSNV